MNRFKRFKLMLPIIVDFNAFSIISRVIRDFRRILQTGTNQSTNDGSYCINSKER